MAGRAANDQVIYVVSKSVPSVFGANELSVFDLQSGHMLHRIPESGRADLPNLLLDRQGARLWWLEDLSTASSLKLLGTSPWAIERFAPVRGAAQYIIFGPSRLALAGSRLFVYKRYAPRQGDEHFWLSAYNPTTLKLEVGRVGMSGCGLADLAATARQLVVACNTSRDVRIVDARTLRVTRTRLPRGWYDPIAGAFVSGKQVYVIDRGMGITEIDPARRKILRAVRPVKPEGPAVPPVYGAALLTDGHTLVAGGMADAQNTESAFTLRVVDLRTLRLVNAVPTGGYVHLAASPDGGVLTFPMGDSADKNWRITWMSSDLSQSRIVTRLDGPVFALASVQIVG
jgi:DNA-binding beta-propeller fold protein YncE